MLALRSGADTSLIGATGRADRIMASAGKDLRLQTLQDVSTYDSKQQRWDPKAVAAVNDAARLELENNQFALPLPAIGAASAWGTLGDLGRRDSNGVASAEVLGSFA